MKRRKPILCLLLSALLLGMPAAAAAAPAGATEKTEVIYAQMETDGSIGEVLAVNGFETTGTITDYGRYDRVINLTNTDPMELTGDRVRIRTEESPFYYQGTLRGAQMPWETEIRYELDGQEQTAHEIAGASGAFAMHVRVRANEKAEKAFAESYLLQIMINLPGGHFSAVDAPDGTIASQGETTMITFTVLPGADADFTVTAEGEDMELGAIQMAGLPFSMDMDLPDLSAYTEDLVLLQDAISELTAGVDSFTGGVASLYDATASLQDGAQGLAGGARSLSGGLREMTDGMGAYQAGLDRYVRELEQGIGAMEFPQMDAGGLDALTAGSRQLHEGMRQLEAGMQHLGPDAAFAQGLDEVTRGSRELSEGLRQLMYGTEEQPGLLAASDAINDALTRMADALQTGLPEPDEEGMAQIASGLENLIGGMQQFLGGLDSAVRELDPAELNGLIDGLYGLRESLGATVYTLRNPGVDLSGVDAETNPQAAALYGVMLAEADRIEARLSAIDAAVAVIEDTGHLLDDIETMRAATLQMIDGTRAVLAEIGEVDIAGMMQDITRLIDGIVTLSTQYRAFNEGLHTGLTGLSAGLDNPDPSSPGLVQGLEQLQAGYAAMTGPILSGMAQLVPGAGQLADGIAQMARMLGELASQFDMESEFGALLAGTRSLRDGHRAMLGGARELSAGLTDYASGVDAYAGGMLRFHEGMYALAGGGSRLSEGMRTLDAETSGMDRMMRERMDEIMDGYLPEDAPEISFVSPKNPGPVRVQFLYMSRPVTAPEPVEEPVQEEEPQGIWERILDLFR